MAEALLVGARGRKITVPTGLFIDNAFSPATDGKSIKVENPANGDHLATLAAAQADDVNRAVFSSAAAFKSWRTVAAPEASRRLLNQLADLIQRDAEQLASLEALDAGVLYSGSLSLHIPQAAECCRYYAGWAGKLDGRSMGISEAGNTIVIKTPELAPLYGQKLAQLFQEAGFPPGVVNILCGVGDVAGQALADHPLFRKGSFTGSGVIGRKILASSARTNLKKVTAELGGKGPSIVFADCSWDNALLHTTSRITVHNGQICAAGSRIYVQDEIYDRFIAEFSARSRDCVAGDPLLGTTTKGPLVSGGQKTCVINYIEGALKEGVKLLNGGQDNAHASGHFLPNTAFVDVPPTATIMREEIFGPVASIAKFKSEDEVIALTNDTNYGLSASISTQDINKAIRVSDAIECGQVTVNMWGTINPNALFGGFKESGFGKDMGREALDEWSQVKCVKFNVLKKA